MTQQGDVQKKARKPRQPGKNMFMWGIGLLVLGVFLAIGNLTTKGTDYVDGVGMVEHQPTVSIGAVLLLLVGLVLSIAGAIIRRSRR